MSGDCVYHQWKSHRTIYNAKYFELFSVHCVYIGQFTKNLSFEIKEVILNHSAYKLDSYYDRRHIHHKNFIFHIDKLNQINTLQYKVSISRTLLIKISKFESF